MKILHLPLKAQWYNMIESGDNTNGETDRYPSASLSFFIPIHKQNRKE